MKKIIALVVLLSMISLGYSAPKEISFSDPSKSISVVSTTPIILIKLKSNPTTGFIWLLANYDHDVLQPISRQFYAPNPAMPGAPGYEVWRFKVNPDAFVVPTLTEIAFVHVRPWAIDEVPEKRVFKVVLSK